jgi:hypothetical protein
MGKPRLINKVAKKRIEAKCYLCGGDVYETLDCHRIVPEEDGGRYTDFNTVVACCLCHRKIHAGLIVIDRWYNSTRGRVLHFIENGQDFWK